MITFVPTPIGNLEDISYRTIKVLEGAEVLLCEDTRVTKRLLHLISDKLSITFNQKDFISVHSHNESSFLETLKNMDLSKNIVYLSDAGMPCISDPGAKIVNFCIQNNIQYDVLPGANALLCAYAMSGFEEKEFLFYGFLPHKEQNRLQELKNILNMGYNTILYESPKRVLILLKELLSIDKDRTIFLAKELTKLYQSTYKGSVQELYNNLKSVDIKGEWVVVIQGLHNDGNLLDFDDIKDLDMPPKQKAKLIAKLKGITPKVAYEEFLDKINK
ncbi:16S rRNA (cytidine(1402)-2'-O)-methyltransferase [Arcobacter sp. FWKO B]|uniref:16S rRNA (cytidine(1402)-2'-O)-methyltransferase n=1 Tax=Arcobacter sp. FWKO B TaxID=2593672 RepID=UPI0018A66AB1|nr:16S rRNA (cytidine(1402)-2'-O)-methyltransferase [Arcobacter sp. FWKO B]QOG12569.1 16S rRNA (cytidine(1402)-2'-O)-methyltransferase [Arcobacter sp. FWKO B]